MCLLISEDQEPHSALNYSSGNFMFKSDASLFKNKSPCIVKDDSHCSRTGHSFMFLDLSLLTEIQKEAVRTGKPGNGKSRLRRKIGLKEQGVLQGRAGAKCTGRAVWGVQCWASRRVQGRSESCCRGQHQLGAQSQTFATSQIYSWWNQWRFQVWSQMWQTTENIQYSVLHSSCIPRNQRMVLFIWMYQTIKQHSQKKNTAKLEECMGTSFWLAKLSIRLLQLRREDVWAIEIRLKDPMSVLNYFEKNLTSCI